ncbi:hypothetical protein HYZ98_02670 [Candidatus Peregrinibacteria bacterium]|nr:hypothetical protein [Candidatus Peregrinibacteria bacterium]
MKKYIVILFIVVFFWPTSVDAWRRFPNSQFSRRVLQDRFTERRANRVQSIQRAQPNRIVSPLLPIPNVSGTDWDTSVPTFLLLGSTSPIVGAARVFPDAEPLNVSAIHIVLIDAVSSVQSFLVYDGQSRFLGNAYLDPSIAGGFTYVLPIKTSTLILPKREVFQFYVKARLRAFEEGGVSGDQVQIRYLVVKGDGFWSNRTYSQSTSETFTVFEMARSMIKKISRVSPETGVLVSGQGQYLGAFQFEGTPSDPGAEIRVTDLTFQVNQAGGIGVSNMRLKRLGSGTSVNCTVSSSIVTCAAISESEGSIRSGPATFQLYGDVSIPSDVTRASLQILLNEPGTSVGAGGVGWTDGQSTFNWVQFDQPVAGGTVFSY